MQKHCIAILLSIVLSSCAFTATPIGDYRVTRSAPIEVHEQLEQGKCSWYGPGFHGRKTANGERFNQNALTAAHKTLPLGSMVEVTNVRNGRTVRVKINDRGPFIKGRIIDLSKAAAIALGTKEAGIGEVQIRIISKAG